MASWHAKNPFSHPWFMPIAKQKEHAQGNKSVLRAVLVEDMAADAELIAFELRRAGYQLNWLRVENEDDYRRAIAQNPEIILSDFAMPQFNGLRALEILHENRLGHTVYHYIRNDRRRDCS